jgi:hypothetical protein
MLDSTAVEPSLRVLSRGESPELTSDVGTRRYVRDFPEAGVTKLGEVIADAGGGPHRSDIFSCHRIVEAPVAGQLVASQRDARRAEEQQRAA